MPSRNDWELVTAARVVAACEAEAVWASRGHDETVAMKRNNSRNRWLETGIQRLFPKKRFSMQ
jgi:hypothetical protein